MTAGDAERTALSEGLLMEVENRFFSGTVPEGRIISQLPSAGEKVRRGTRVRVALSLGQQKIVIPSVVGQSQRAAEMNIARRGLELGSVAVATLPGYPSDQVLAQSPPANAEGVASPKVNLLVSAPPDPTADLYLTPDFVGRTLEEASRAIAESPMRFGKVTTVKRPANTAVGTAAGAASVPPATSLKPAVVAKSSPVIVRQNPAAGQKIPPGTMINFEVAR
jgi:beta-lactam-binding protein with PASTA domain